MIVTRSKLAGPLASGAVHAGLIGLVVGFGMAEAPPAPPPLSVELVVPAAAPAMERPPAPPETPPLADPQPPSEEPAPALTAAIDPPAERAVLPRPKPVPRPALPVAPAETPPAETPPAPLQPTAAIRAAAHAGETRAVALAGNHPPAYPERARRRGIEGQVLLGVLVDSEGRAVEILVARSSGSELLDESARKAVAGWTFSPARVGGVAVSARVEVPVAFRLADAAP